MLVRSDSFREQGSSLAEVVCADADLLALEFDALVAANFPDSADRPNPRPPRPSARLLTRRPPRARPTHPVRRDPLPVADGQADEEGAEARERGPPRPAVPTDRIREVMP
jgi:hypothetical protein